ncbi:YtxH domain-containing protein [Paenibacillus nasutitermitis]|uniref:Gas vesicle protein n=1 Tax=Paenibacillus nasutitermitis TaxID=1652958 RepID=A0A916YNR8_9BACL|nr:YtxH domain-containing protein [Paenibacillus nasutitermitis]GGD54224.1 hypothetical protein GCM10010911_09730 [Paenibacillus nasutitermitis]
MAKYKRSNSFLLGAFAGGIIGSITALLLAPKAGKELRSDISASTREATSRTVRAVTNASDCTARAVKQVGHKAAVLTDKAKDTAGQVIGSISSWRGARQDDLQGSILLDSVASDAIQEAREEAKEAIENDR